MTQIIAHRGASALEPENTVNAFLRAVTEGADGIELDVRRTADDRLVIHHDPALLDGRVIRATRSTDLPASIPLLDDALDACDGTFVNIEIKNSRSEPDFDPSDWVVTRVGRTLAGRGAGRRWLLSSFRLGTVDRCRQEMPSVRTAWLVKRLTLDVISRASDHGHDAVHPDVRELTEAMVRSAHNAGLAVNAWTCDDPARIAELISWGVDGICTNVIGTALAVRRGVSA